jgi:DNA excision repair protein ERCC-6
MTELWSIVDFVHPGHLGTLPTFNNEFGGPIKASNYANASEMAIQTGVRAATALKEMIDPFLMRRLKADVAADLPKKSEKVVFCELSDDQVRLYLDFLQSEGMDSVRSGKKNRLYAIDALRKICNHPDLLERDVNVRIAVYLLYIPLTSF